MTSPEDIARTQEIEAALDDARACVAALRQLDGTGARAVELLDRVEAALNTARPAHVGWADDQLPAASVVEEVAPHPEGLSGAPSGAEAAQVGDDGLTDEERAAADVVV